MRKINNFLSRPLEVYEHHIDKCFNSYRILDKDNLIKDMVHKLAQDEDIIEYEEFIYHAIIDVIKFHDIGKKSPYFQSYVGNTDFSEYDYNKLNKEHSIISSYYYLEKYYNKINDLNLKKKTTKMLREIICVLSTLIKSHHSAISSYNKATMFTSIKNKLEYKDMFFDGYNENVVEFFKNGVYEFKKNTIYILSKYVFSVLVTCDFMAVYEFKEGKSLKINSIDSIKKEEFKERLNSSNIIKDIRLFEAGILNLNDINKYRSEMFLEAEKNILKYKDNKMFYLEAPTGCGKSLTALNLTLNMVDDTYNKIIYVAPFSNIIEQTYKDVKSFIGNKNKDVVSVSYTEEIVTSESEKEDESYEDYNTDNMDRLLLNYPFTVISHIRLFDALLGYKRKDCIMTTLMSNSIIVLDEIQSYKNALWIPLINLLKDVAENLNIKIIIMSATLPKLDILLEDKSFKIKDLIDRRDYYYDFFKTRYEPDFSLLEQYTEDREKMKEIVINKILDVAKIGKRILVGTITKKTCEEIYQILKGADLKNYEIYKIDSCTSILNKEMIINKLKEKNGIYTLKKVILIATQCIEAGVDIDMEIGFKNIGILDSDEQFAGRIQRNFKEKGIVYYFKIDDVGIVYKGDYRAERTLMNLEWQDILKNKKFYFLYNKCYGRLIKDKNHSKNNENKMKTLKYKEFYEEMKLINDDNKIKLLMVCKMKINNEIIDLSKELAIYHEIKKSNIDYSEKDVKLSRFKKIFNMFTYTISIFDLNKINSTREFGGYKLIENAEQYYTNLDDGRITSKSQIDLEKLLNVNIHR